MATENIVVKEQPHTLTTTEREALGNQIAAILDEEDDLEDEKASATARFKSREKDLKEKKKKLRDLHKKGFEIRKFKCYERRDRDTNTVNFVVAEGPQAGHIIDSRPFTQDDWTKEYTLFDMDNPGGVDEEELRNPAPVEPEEEQLEPTRDALGNVVAGPETDAYNMKYPDSPYQHLSELVDFAPAIPSHQAEDAAAEQPSTETEQSEKPVLYANVNEVGDVIDGPETELYNEVITVATMQDDSVEALLLAMSPEEVLQKLAQLDQYDQEPQSAIEFYATALRGVLAKDSTDNGEGEDEPTAEDEPQPGDEPKPKRPARKRKPKTDD